MKTKSVRRAGTTRRITKRVYTAGQCVRVATQYDGTILAEIVEMADHGIIVVKSKEGKMYRIFSAEIV